MMSGGEDILLVSEWEDLTVAQLKEELTGRGLDTSGRKSDLVARLEANDREILDAQKHKEGDSNKDGDEELVVWAEDEVGQEEDQDQLVLDDDEADGDLVTDPSVEKPAAKESEKTSDNKTVTEEFHVDVSKDKDVFILTWHGQKIAIPFKNEVQKDIRRCVKKQNIIMYPVEISDVYDETIKSFIEKAINVSMELDEIVPGQASKGYLRLKFGSAALAANAAEVLRAHKPGGRELTLENFGEDDSEGHVLSKIKSKDAVTRDPLLHRLMFVSNLPSDTTEETLRIQFQDALRVIIPAKEETSERNGYAYVEYASEADVVNAVAQHKDLELNGQKLYVIKSMTEKKETFGLLRDSLRKYWLEQIKSLDSVKAKPHNKSVRELQELETKLGRLKKRIARDNRKRLELGLPVPDSEVFQVPEGDSDKEDAEKDKERERDSFSSRRDSRAPDRRNPPPRRHYSPSRSRSSYRYGSSSFRGGPPGMPPRADHLVNQLHEIVGALSDIRGGRGGRGGYYEGGRRGGGSSYGRDYPVSSSRYGGKRPGDMEYGGDRKRHMDDYPGYDGGRSSSGYGSYGGSHRGGSSYNY